MHSTESLSSGHSDTNTAKRPLIHLYDKKGDDMLNLSDSEEAVSFSQSVVREQSRNATLFE